MRPNNGFLAVFLTLVQVPNSHRRNRPYSWRIYSAMAEQVLFAVPL